MTLKRICVVAMLLAALSAPQTTAQQKPKNGPERRATNQASEQQPPAQIRIFALRYADVESVADEIRVLLGPRTRIAANARTNSLIVHGTKDELQVLEGILERLDEPDKQSRENERITELIELRSKPARSLREMLQLTIDPRRTNFVVDESRNMVVVRGSKSEVDRIRELVQLVDHTQPKAQPNEPLKLRVIWLTTKRDDAPVAKMPADLNPVIASLEKIGIDNLGLATQLLVNVGEPNEQFSIQGAVAGDMILVDGVRQGEKSAPARLELNISVEGPAQQHPSGRGQQRESVAQLRAAVTLAPQQMVVLGASPTQRGNSVFVVQLFKGL